MPHTANEIGNSLFALVFSVIGLSMLIGVLLGIRKSKSVQQWPSTTGRITESTTLGSFQQSGKGRIWIEEPKLSYTYVVDGKEYTGHDIGIAETDTASKQAAEDKIAPYPMGKDVTVFYNPKSPDDSVLEKQLDTAALSIVGIIGSIFLVIGIVIFLNSSRF
jgi:hypothetical protein